MNTFRIVLSSAFAAFTIICSAQSAGSRWEVDPSLDFSPFQTVYKSEIEICDSPEGDARSAICVWKQMKQTAMNEGLQPYTIKKNGIMMTSDNSTVRKSSSNSAAQERRRAEAIRKQQNDAYRKAIFEQRRQARLAAAREALRKKREKKIREQQAENRKAQAVRDQTNEQLQGMTDRRIQNDQWHATQGREQARQVAREQIGPRRGMIITAPSQNQQSTAMSGQSMAARMRNKTYLKKEPMPKEGGMGYYSRRPAPPVVRQKPNKAGQYVFTGRATKTSIFIKADKRSAFKGNTSGPALAKTGTQFRLDPHAMVTTGQDWHSDDFKQPKRKIPRPATAIVKPLSYDEFLDEMLSTD